MQRKKSVLYDLGFTWHRTIPMTAWARVVVPLSILMITMLHYLTGAELLPYHSIYRSLYYVPITIAALRWGWRGAIITSLGIAATYVPHFLWLREALLGGVVDNVLEIMLFFVVGTLVGVLAEGEHKQRQQAEALRRYIDAVLASLPVGIVTVTDAGEVASQNAIAQSMLRQNLLNELPQHDGYTEMMLDSRPVGIRRSPLREPIHRGAVLVLEDLSEQRRLARQVRQAERLAALGRLAGGLAHEIRNPLGVVRATAQLLAARLASHSDLQRYAHVLTTESDRIDRLVSELLDYAHPRELQLQLVAVAPLLEDITAALTAYAEQQRLRLTVIAPPEIAVRADPDRLRQALLNLLLNAMQASPPGQSVAIRVEQRRTEVCFAIEDRGRGVTPDIAEKVFDPFFTTKDYGTGLGLSIVARIAEDHHGRITLDRRPGGGMVALLTLPSSREEG